MDESRKTYILQSFRNTKNSSRACLSIAQELWQTDVSLRNATLGREGGTVKPAKPVKLPDAPDIRYEVNVTKAS